MAVREFIHDIMDMICDFFLGVWDTVVNLIKTAVRFVGRAVDFFANMFRKSWDAIKAGTEKVFLIFFNKDKVNVTNTEAEKKFVSMLGNVINTETKNGRVIECPIFAVTMNKDTSTVEDYKAFTLGKDVVDPTMVSMKKSVDIQNKAVSVVSI